jgi:ribonuclease D
LKLVQTQQDLASTTEEIRSIPWIALDTEADSMYHYIEKLCLVQISTDMEDYVIDPLVPLDLTEFIKVIESKKILLQGADSDIRLLKRFHAFSPKNVFDTVIAAQILGYPKMGLQDLAARHCGVHLSKAEQKADWSKRPLENSMIEYAANDTHYMKHIHDAMEKELIEAGRLSWHTECCQKLLTYLENRKEAEKNTPEWQVKGSKNLSAAALTYLRDFWAWRDGLAQSKDKPPYKILNTDYLLEMSEWAALNPGKDIIEWTKAPRHIRNEFRDTMNAIIKKAATLPPTPYVYPPKIKNRTVWTEKDSKVLDGLKVFRETKSKELGIMTSVLSTNAVLEELVVKKPKSIDDMKNLDGVMHWQAEVFGEEVLKILQGPTA